MRYATIVADPPWPYDATDGGLLRSSRTHRPNSFGSNVGIRGRYESMPVLEIRGLPVASHADVNAHLYLWTTNAFMYEAHDVARAWGFKPKTICTWGKVQPDGRPSMRTGYWFRGATEHCLFCVRGSLRLLTSDPVPTLWLWPRAGHSVKPGAFYDLVERVSPGPRLELFARVQRLGWHTWGDEALNHVGALSPASARSEATPSAAPPEGETR